jgi:AcrR family transcriptional regulator
MSAAEKRISADKTERISPRERILAAASELFYRHGIRAVGVETVAEVAQTNKMTLYRHFSSKDELVAGYLRSLAEKAKLSWDQLEADHPGAPPTQLRAAGGNSRHVASGASAGARWRMPPLNCLTRTIRRGAYRSFQERAAQRLIQLCAAARLNEPETLADELFLLLEGARVTARHEPERAR